MTSQDRSHTPCTGLTKQGTPCTRNAAENCTTQQGGPACRTHDVTGALTAAQVKTRAAKASFLDGYRLTCNVSLSAESAGVSRRRVYDWLDQDPEFAAGWAEAREEAVEALESEARRRAMLGTTKVTTRGHFFQGEQVGEDRNEVTEYSDTLLIFLLKAARPEVYRERLDARVKVSAEDGVMGGEVIDRLTDRLESYLQGAAAAGDVARRQAIEAREVPADG